MKAIVGLSIGLALGAVIHFFRPNVVRRFHKGLWSFLEPPMSKARARVLADPVGASVHERIGIRRFLAILIFVFAAVLIAGILGGCGLRTNIILPPRTQYQSCSDVLFGLTSMCHSAVFASDQPVAIGGTRGIVFGGAVGVPSGVQPGSDYGLCYQGRSTLQPWCPQFPPGQPGTGQYPGPRFAPDEWSDPFFGESLGLDGVLHVPLE